MRPAVVAAGISSDLCSVRTLILNARSEEAEKIQAGNYQEGHSSNPQSHTLIHDLLLLLTAGSRSLSRFWRGDIGNTPCDYCSDKRQ